ncbi:imidazolonepropionase [Deinococcus cellulosilyticus]|uniref:Imidazolonepropionase n=1 Tax=Deinococcus cellulosilyticus (strain DSM 18568 / NBRC 106333 / KACC 11606 / 5516J-15) TaxID=1223518 RepID=A0A511N423_DEIC1|nr:imidazolonepropionase [Deinococcus cellulosilyticus]GEM47131.1 imidazolonepropionase [Deinococcus cellulosilyticus NBRC 106333 = KACC 11606]
MKTLYTGITELATATGNDLKKGSAQKDITIIRDAAMVVEGETLLWVGERKDAPAADRTIDFRNKAVVPGLIDPHTHLIWSGSRLNDFEARVQGVSYEEILARGGGIHQTVRYTQASTAFEMVSLAVPRLNAMVRSGATTLEVKTGYGLNHDTEMRMLEAIRDLQDFTPARIVPTLLIHLPPKDRDRKDFIREVVEKWIPEVAQDQLAAAVDVFVEQEAFSVQEAREILEAAKAHGLHTKLHADQFHALGGVELACELGSLSVDHLEASTGDQIQALAASNTVATVLPGVTLHLGLPAAPARKIIDAGGAVAVGTDHNPGSSPMFSTSLALALGVRLNGLTPAEALTAMTANAAHALGLKDTGRLEAGMKADFLVLDSHDWREISYRFGNAVSKVFISGKEA